MRVVQISLFLENKPGTLAAATRLLYEAGVNIRALSIAEAGEFGVVRLVVDDAERCYEVLRAAGFTVSKTEVLGVEMDDRPGALFEIADALGRASININYAYAFSKGGGKAILIMSVDSVERAVEVLRAAGAKLVGVEALT
ncbi:MAG: ACT domain-containing protein [Candidatus Alkanophagales archaeon]